jgi:hypothetical protein
MSARLWAQTHTSTVIIHQLAMKWCSVKLRRYIKSFRIKAVSHKWWWVVLMTEMESILTTRALQQQLYNLISGLKLRLLEIKVSHLTRQQLCMHILMLPRACHQVSWEHLVTLLLIWSKAQCNWDRRKLLPKLATYWHLQDIIRLQVFIFRTRTILQWRIWTLLTVVRV